MKKLWASLRNLRCLSHQLKDLFIHTLWWKDWYRPHTCKHYVLYYVPMYRYLLLTYLGTKERPSPHQIVSDGLDFLILKVYKKIIFPRKIDPILFSTNPFFEYISHWYMGTRNPDFHEINSSLHIRQNIPSNLLHNE